MAASNGQVKFSFNKKIEKTLKRSRQIDDVSNDCPEEKIFLSSVEENELKTVNLVEKKSKDLIIPLIKNNRWNRPMRPEDLEKEDTEEVIKKPLPSVNTGDSLTDKAVLEILKDSKSYDQTSEDAGIAIPLLMANKIPEGYETDNNFDVTLRPNIPTLEDYESIPIEQFGVAMLRGMGWKPGQGVGKNNRVVKLMEATVRPRGLGLGANRSSAKNVESNLDANNEELKLVKGAHCVVTTGRNKDLFGIIEEIDEDNVRCTVKLALNSKTVTISQHTINLVSQTEYKKYSKYLNKNKSDEYVNHNQEKGNTNTISTYRNSTSDEEDRVKIDSTNSTRNTQHRSDNKHDSRKKSHHKSKHRHKDRHREHRL